MYLNGRALAWLRAEPEGGTWGYSALFHSPLRLLASVYPQQSSFFQPLSHTVWTYLWHQQGILLASAPGGELGLTLLLSLPEASKETMDRTTATRSLVRLSNQFIS